MRVTLELRGLQRAVESGTAHDPAMLEPLRDTWRALRDDQPAPDPAFVVLDEEFHITLSRASGNAELAHMLDAINARIRPVRMHDFVTADRVELTISQHLGIVERVLAGDLEGSVAALRQHVGESMDVVEKRAARAITQMVLNRSRASGIRS
ncbi:FCD domain-containing protein [Frankia sp. AvcI1]|uniref:GntR family transcriptional regulator n=1 Tax=Frankia sp. AvcI1 TaxID=573496 RepID=UPI002285812C|nr:FCD domain-containing protein [Frankia sp. AvcI1]